MTNSNRCPCNGFIPNCPLCGGFGTVSCAICGGTRVLAKMVAEGTYVAKSCMCQGEAVPVLALDPGLPEGAKKWNFESMRGDYKELTEAGQSIRKIVREKKGWFVFHTPSGRGKTYLLCCAVNEALALGQSAVYVDASGILQKLQSAMLGNEKLTYDALLRELIAVDLLCIDEFGVQTDTQFRLSTLRMILDARSDKGGWKATGFATNCQPAELTRRFPWLVSRFQHEWAEEFTLSKVPNLRALVPAQAPKLAL